MQRKLLVYRFFCILICSLLSLTSFSQTNMLVEVRPLKQPDKNGRYNIEAILTNGDKIPFSFTYKFLVPPLYDSYADTSYCTLIFMDDVRFIIVAAYKDPIHNEWVVDYPYYRVGRGTGITGSGMVRFIVNDLSINDKNIMKISFDVQGDERLIKKIHGDMSFPIVSKCILAQSGLYIFDNEKFLGLKVNPPNSNSTRIIIKR